MLESSEESFEGFTVLRSFKANEIFSTLCSQLQVTITRKRFIVTQYYHKKKQNP